MLLKLGIATMSVALLMAGAVAVFAFSQRDQPVFVAHTAKEPSRSSEPQVFTTEVRAGTVPTSLKPEQRSTPEQRSKPEQRVEPKPQVVKPPDPKPPAKLAASRRPVPVAKTKLKTPPERNLDWPTPTREQVRGTKEPRHYQLTAGAAMGLTIKAIGLYNVPVFDSRGQWALDNGVAHVPETSMPWSKGAQRNVYLEGHRLGYPGTGSHLVFYNLDKLGRGDKVVLRSRSGKSYEYRVISTFIVTPKDSWVMGQVRGRDLVTLQTCTGPSWSQRLIVRAERI